jgi:hypothetical protein
MSCLDVVGRDHSPFRVDHHHPSSLRNQSKSTQSQVAVLYPATPPSWYSRADIVGWENKLIRQLAVWNEHLVIDAVRCLRRECSCDVQKGHVDSENQHETLGAMPSWKTDMKLKVKYDVP